MRVSSLLGREGDGTLFMSISLSLFYGQRCLNFIGICNLDTQRGWEQMEAINFDIQSLALGFIEFKSYLSSLFGIIFKNYPSPFF